MGLRGGESCCAGGGREALRAELNCFKGLEAGGGGGVVGVGS